jgi:hypothetical protein
MISYKLNHSYELDDSFMDYLQSTVKVVNEYESLLDALQKMNSQSEKKKPIVFVRSKCSRKGYACLYCDESKFDSSIEDLEKIIQLHTFKKEHMNTWHSNLNSIIMD